MCSHMDIGQFHNNKDRKLIFVTHKKFLQSLKEVVFHSTFLNTQFLNVFYVYMKEHLSIYLFIYFEECLQKCSL